MDQFPNVGERKFPMLNVSNYRLFHAVFFDANQSRSSEQHVNVFSSSFDPTNLLTQTIPDISHAVFQIWT